MAGTRETPSREVLTVLPPFSTGSTDGNAVKIYSGGNQVTSSLFLLVCLRKWRNVPQRPPNNSLTFHLL